MIKKEYITWNGCCDSVGKARDQLSALMGMGIVPSWQTAIMALCCCL